MERAPFQVEIVVVHCCKSSKLSPNFVRYCLNLCESLLELFLSLERLNSWRPASDIVRLSRQMAMTCRSWYWSNRSMSSICSPFSTSSKAGSASVVWVWCQNLCSRSHSSFTIVSLIRPPSDKVAMRCTAALRSRKFPDHRESD